jgi:DNA-binding transcriptional ArsR family regulator
MRLISICRQIVWTPPSRPSPIPPGAIVARLASGEASVTELAEPFEMSFPAVSKHLKVLERAGLIARGREAQWRPCRLEAAPLKDAADWLERYRRFWEQSLDRLDDYLRELQTRPW